MKCNNLVSRREGRGVAREGASVEHLPLWEKVVLLLLDEDYKEEANFYK